MFKNHLEMIGRNETPSKKAKFWQSYVRSLKGSEDIRAHETPRPRSYRPYSAYTDLPTHWKSIFDEPATPAERIASHGYRYLPVHRETYGYSPRPIYDHHYSRSIPSCDEETTIPLIPTTSTTTNENDNDYNLPQRSRIPLTPEPDDDDIDIINKIIRKRALSKSVGGSGGDSLASILAYGADDGDGDMPTIDDMKRKFQSRKEAMEKFLQTNNPIEYGEYREKTKDYLKSKRDAHFNELKEKHC